MKQNKRIVVCTTILSLLFTLMQVIGYQISMLYGTSVHQSDFFQSIGMLTLPQCLILGLVEFLIWFVLLALLFRFLDKLWDKSSAPLSYRFTKPVLWIGIIVLLFLCWIPALMACYPGCFNYDAIGQIPQAMYEDVPYNTHHPLLHTLIMGKIVKYALELTDEGLGYGIYIYCLFQMMVCSVILTYSLYCTLKICRSKLVAAISFLYYAFFPTIVLFTMSTTKDVLFSLFFHLVVLCVYEMFWDLHAFFTNPGKLIRLVLFSVLACLFRNNGIYAILLFSFFAILMNKKYRLKIFLLSLSLLFIYAGCSKGLEYGLQAKRGGKIEMLSVPLQQFARAYRDHNADFLEEEELEFLYTVVSHDTLMSYNPFSSDNVKNYIYNDTLFANIRDLFKLWMKAGIEHPMAYLQAFLENTYQAWYPGTSIYDKPGAEETFYFTIDMSGKVQRETKFPSLLTFYKKISTDYYYQKIPVVRILFSVGAMFWIALLTFFYGVYKKRFEIIMPMILVLAYCFTNLLGPISLVRYYLILFYGFPVFISFLLSGDNKKNEGLIKNEDLKTESLMQKNP